VLAYSVNSVPPTYEGGITGVRGALVGVQTDDDDDDDGHRVPPPLREDASQRPQC